VITSTAFTKETTVLYGKFLTSAASPLENWQRHWLQKKNNNIMFPNILHLCHWRFFTAKNFLVKKLHHFSAPTSQHLSNYLLNEIFAYHQYWLHIPECSSQQSNKASTFIVGVLFRVVSLQVCVEEVGECPLAIKKLLIRADLGNSAVDHHNDLIELRQEADPVCDEDTCLSHTTQSKPQSATLTLWCPLLPYGYSYEASCATPG